MGYHPLPRCLDRKPAEEPVQAPAPALVISLRSCQLAPPASSSTAFAALVSGFGEVLVSGFGEERDTYCRAVKVVLYCTVLYSTVLVPLAHEIHTVTDKFDRGNDDDDESERVVLGFWRIFTSLDFRRLCFDITRYYHTSLCSTQLKDEQVARPSGPCRAQNQPGCISATVWSIDTRRSAMARVLGSSCLQKNRHACSLPM